MSTTKRKREPAAKPATHTCSYCSSTEHTSARHLYEFGPRTLRGLLAENDSLKAELQRARKRSRANARKAEERRVVIVATMERLEELQRRLRDTAEGLRSWWKDQSTAPPNVHPLHAANRLERLADEIRQDGGKEKCGTN